MTTQDNCANGGHQLDGMDLGLLSMHTAHDHHMQRYSQHYMIFIAHVVLYTNMCV